MEREYDRSERERYEPPDVGGLSDAAKALLRACIDDAIPDGDETNCSAFRELVAARIMMPMGSFVRGDECVFHWTYWGFKLRHELLERPTDSGRAPSRERSPLPAR